MRFWRNPEFVRHLRAELRPTRALTVAAVAIALCILIWLGIWGGRQAEMAAWRGGAREFGNPTPERLAQLERESPEVVWRSFYWTLMYAQMGILTFWSLLSCALSISGERERGTWDFQRATRLSAGELLLGKLLGEPVLAYFVVLCCLPIVLLGCAAGHAGWRNVLSGYVLIFSAALFIGLVGLWLSSLFESRSRGVGLIGTFGIYAIFGYATLLSESAFPGAAAFSPVTGLTALFRADAPLLISTLFGRPVPWLLLTLLLYATFGAWFALMILRTLKKDLDQAKPLSRWQAVACAAFLGFSLYALFYPKSSDSLRGYEFASFMAVVNGVFLFALGLAIVTPHERLRVWWRTRKGPAALFAEEGPPWPWMVISAFVGYGLLVWGMFAWKNVVGFSGEVLLAALVQFVTVAVYVTRDVLFIQWCRLTRLRAPLVKGFLFVSLYYAAAIVFASVAAVSSADRGRSVYALLTPVGAFAQDHFKGDHFSPAVFVGIGIQAGAIFLLHVIITTRLRRFATASPAGD
jgi:hypothetical protein